MQRANIFLDRVKLSNFYLIFSKITEFIYNAHSDWLKKRALREYKTRSFSCHAPSANSLF